MGLREIAYRATGSRAAQAVLRRIARAVRVPGLAVRTARVARHPFLVVVTVDTEGGYVDDDERRRWQGELPGAFQGYLHGVRNLLSVLATPRVPATFLLSTHAFSSAGSTRAEIDRVLAHVRREGHEIGLHLHPASDRALAQRLGKSFGARVADDEKVALVQASCALLTEALGDDARPVSFRWGNWGLDAGGVRALAAAGFKVDSSAVPGIGDSRQPRDPRFDWRRAHSHVPWWLSTTDHQSTDGDAEVLEIPIATGRWLGRSWRADPLFGPLLHAMFARYYEHAPRDRAPFPFVLMTHSSEATTRSGDVTRTLRDLSGFLRFAAGHADVELVTLARAHDLYLGARR